MELTLSYWDALDLLNIESEKDARDYDGLCIAPDGITLIAESYRDVLTPGEIAELLRQYPHAVRGEPILTFPVAWPAFKRFIEMWSLVGCVDGVKAVDWVLASHQPGEDPEAGPETKPPGKLRADVKRNLNALVGLLTLALVKRSGPGFRQITLGREGPNLSAVAIELLDIAKAERLGTEGLSTASLGDHLAAGQVELGERRPG
jgi:hypothetical protein